MRRGITTDPEQYIRVRLKMLYTERNKNNTEVAHLVLDKAIYELSIVLDLLKRNK